MYKIHILGRPPLRAHSISIDQINYIMDRLVLVSFPNPFPLRVGQCWNILRLPLMGEGAIFSPPTGARDVRGSYTHGL